jgi:hypothetical protein
MEDIREEELVGNSIEPWKYKTDLSGMIIRVSYGSKMLRRICSPSYVKQNFAKISQEIPIQNI